MTYLGSFIEVADLYQVRKSFRIPTAQLLLLNDNDELIELRAVIAMKHLFSNLFRKVKDKYYVLALETVQLLFFFASNIESVYKIFRKHKDLLYPEIFNFLSKDPTFSLNQMQWVPSIPRNSTTLELNRKLITDSVQDMLDLNILDKKNKLEEIFGSSTPPPFMTLKQTMVGVNYQQFDEIQFFSEKYKDWITASINQIINDGQVYSDPANGLNAALSHCNSEVIHIECNLSNKERNSPIFVFKEIIESLDKEMFGDSIQEIETAAYFHRLFKLISVEL